MMQARGSLHILQRSAIRGVRIDIVGSNQRCPAGDGQISKVLKPLTIITAVEMGGAEIDRTGSLLFNIVKTLSKVRPREFPFWRESNPDLPLTRLVFLTQHIIESEMTVTFRRPTLAKREEL